MVTRAQTADAAVDTSVDAAVDAAVPDAWWHATGGPNGECPISHAVGVLDGKWTLLVVRELLGGRKRFTELRRGLPGVNPKTLTERLRALEDDGLVTRTAYAEIPPRVEYELTERAAGLAPVFEALAAWGLEDLRRQSTPT